MVGTGTQLQKGYPDPETHPRIVNNAAQKLCKKWALVSGNWIHHLQ
jgi:hypothetical protein